MPLILAFDLPGTQKLSFDLPTILLYAILFFHTETACCNKILTFFRQGLPLFCITETPPQKNLYN